MEGIAAIKSIIRSSIIALSAPKVGLLSWFASTPFISCEGGENIGIGWLLKLVHRVMKSPSSQGLLSPPASNLAALLQIGGKTRPESGITMIYAVIM